MQVHGISERITILYTYIYYIYYLHILTYMVNIWNC